MNTEDSGNSTEPIDELYTQACLESRESLKAYGLDIDSIEAEARRGAQAPKRAKNRRILLRVLLITACAFLIFNVLMFTLDLPWAKNYQFQLRMWISRLAGVSSSRQETLTLCSSADIKEAQKKVPFPIPFPQWLPDGFALKDATVDTNNADIFYVNLRYKNEIKLIQVLISNETALAKTLPSSKEPKYEKLDIGTQQVYALFYQMDNTSFATCNFYNEEGLHVIITGPLDRQSLFKLIESLS